MIFEVYLNRRAMGTSPSRVYSVRAATGKNRGKVIGSSKKILMKNVSFVVQPSGRKDTLERIKRGGTGPTKTVHAFLRGEVVSRGNHAVSRFRQMNLKKFSSVTYNPVKTDSFMTGEARISHAKFALLDESSINVVI